MNIYPYRKNTQGDFYPLIDLFVYRRGRPHQFLALVDSGASISIFKQDVAKTIGIDVTKGKKINIGGVGGHIVAYRHRLQIKIADKLFYTPILFSFEYAASFNLLGRSGIFDKFRITFDEMKRVVELS